jgi:cysteine desulfurase
MGVVGMVAAMEETVAARDGFRSRVAGIRDEFEQALAAQVPGATVNGPRHDRLVQHSHVRFRGHGSETLLIRLDQAGVAAAAGSACQSGAVEPSHVLAAMGMDQTAASEAIRFSFGWSSRPDDGRLAARIVADLAREPS